MKFKKSLITAAAALAVCGTALADITIGVVAPLTGPASGLGIPTGNQVKLWPTTIAGEKVKVIVLDDATDPTNGTKIAKRFVTEDKVDVIMGSARTNGPSACPSPTPSWPTPWSA
jgi:branched-chain amino acid transport system substrate-binding protein